MKTIFPQKRKPGYWRRLLIALVLELVGAVLLLIWVAIPWYMSDRAAHPPRVALGSETPAQSSYGKSPMPGTPVAGMLTQKNIARN